MTFGSYLARLFIPIFLAFLVALASKIIGINAGLGSSIFVGVSTYLLVMPLLPDRIQPPLLVKAAAGAAAGTIGWLIFILLF